MYVTVLSKSGRKNCSSKWDFDTSWETKGDGNFCFSIWVLSFCDILFFHTGREIFDFYHFSNTFSSVKLGGERYFFRNFVKNVMVTQNTLQGVKNTFWTNNSHQKKSEVQHDKILFRGCGFWGRKRPTRVKFFQNYDLNVSDIHSNWSRDYFDQKRKKWFSRQLKKMLLPLKPVPTVGIFLRQTWKK